MPGAARLGPPLLAPGVLQGQVPVRRRGARVHQGPRRGPAADHGQRASGKVRRRPAPPNVPDARGLRDLRGRHRRHRRVTLVPDRVHVKLAEEYSAAY